MKLRGPDYSMREIAFDRFAQELGISCQSVVYLRLQSDAIPLTQQPEESTFQAAHLLLPEHEAGSCSPSCPLAPFQDHCAPVRKRCMRATKRTEGRQRD